MIIKEYYMSLNKNIMIYAFLSVFLGGLQDIFKEKPREHVFGQIAPTGPSLAENCHSDQKFRS